MTVVCEGTWQVDKTRSTADNMYLVMQRDGHMEIRDRKKGPDGNWLYRIKWGSIQDSAHHFTWVPASFMEMPKAQELVAEYNADPIPLDGRVD